MNEIRAELDNQYNRVKIVSDLLGVEQVSLGREEYGRNILSIQVLRAKLAPLTQEPLHESANTQDRADDFALKRLSARTAKLTESWTTFYTRQLDDPGVALAAVVVTAEPLAQADVVRFRAGERPPLGLQLRLTITS